MLCSALIPGKRHKIKTHCYHPGLRRSKDQAQKGEERANSLAQADAWSWSQSQRHLLTNKELIIRQNVELEKRAHSS